jgi:hypothetical protein
MQQGSARWYRYWMRRWSEQIGSGVPRNRRLSSRGKAADTYERPWWMKRFEPYESHEEMYVIRAGRRVYYE